MKGLELARAYYEAYGKPMLEEKFPHLLPKIAVGLVGSGSECFGYDDEVSQDHDFEPCFCLFLPGEDVVSRRDAFLLERAYAKLPDRYQSYKRSPLSPVGGNRHGVILLEDFLREKTGHPQGELSVGDWFRIPEQTLAEVSNGALFHDGAGDFTAIRDKLSYLPEAVRLKKLAGHLLTMGQAGQYNYSRCIQRGETGAAQLAVIEFVKSAIHAVFLLNRVYLPYYKWQFRALRELPRLGDLAPVLEELISNGNDPERATQKHHSIQRICEAVMRELRNQNLSDYPGDEIDGYAYAINDLIRDSNLRNLHILFGV